MADNTLWDGKVVTEPQSRDAQTVGILRFNEKLTHDPADDRKKQRDRKDQTDSPFRGFQQRTEGQLAFFFVVNNFFFHKHSLLSMLAIARSDKGVTVTGNILSLV